jgi:putative addiction module component (TIGR02574 family)
MGVNDIPEIAQMSISEKILFLEDLWDSIGSDESDIPVPQAHKDELDARLKNYEANPGNLLSLEELQERIGRRK